MEANAICLYTDGSAIGNPGPGGYGLRLESESTGHIKEQIGRASCRERV